MTDLLIGRQEILSTSQSIFAYEILFRGADVDLSESEAATNATNEVIMDTLTEIGLNRIVGNAKAFINFTEQNILDGTPLNLPKDRVVIEVLENVSAAPEVVKALQKLAQEGYTIALDDFDLTPELLPLVELADIIKLDVMANSVEKTLEYIEALKPYNVTLLAEKVETHEMFNVFKKAGCELFQGFFFNKPIIVPGKRIGVSQVASIQLLTQVNDPEVTFAALGKIVSHDVGLSYKLLRYINSAFFGLPNKVESITQAVTYLGLNEVKRWVNIITLSSLSDKPNVVFQQSLIRGKHCELLGDRHGETSGSLFLIGMLSTLDCVLDMPLEEAVGLLPLTSEVREAILLREGVAGAILSDVISYERWELDGHKGEQSLPDNVLGEIYLESIEWAREVCRELG